MNAGKIAWGTVLGASVALQLSCGIAQPGNDAIGGPTPNVRVHSDVPWSETQLERVAISNTLQRFHEAASRADFEAYFSAWTDDSVFLGTDATERWVGEEFKDFARPHFEKGTGWTYVVHERNITVSADGRLGFFDELLENEKLGRCRGSGVMAKVGEGWKILQYNLSIPVPNELAAELTGRIRAAGSVLPGAGGGEPPR